MGSCQEDTEVFTLDGLAEYISSRGGEGGYSSAPKSASAASLRAALPLSMVTEQPTLCMVTEHLTRMHEVGEPHHGGFPLEAPLSVGFSRKEWACQPPFPEYVHAW